MASIQVNDVVSRVGQLLQDVTHIHWPLAEKLQYDLYYVKNHSLILDTLVLFETVRVVLTGEGAH